MNAILKEINEVDSSPEKEVKFKKNLYELNATIRQKNILLDLSPSPMPKGPAGQGKKT